MIAQVVPVHIDLAVVGIEVDVRHIAIGIARARYYCLAPPISPNVFFAKQSVLTPSVVEKFFEPDCSVKPNKQCPMVALGLPQFII